MPERGQNLLPFSAAVRNIVQQFFKAGGKFGVHISLKERHKERCYQPTARFRNKAPIFKLHIIAVTQHGQD